MTEEGPVVDLIELLCVVGAVHMNMRATKMEVRKAETCSTTVAPTMEADEEFEEESDFEYNDDQEQAEDDGRGKDRQCVYCGARARRIYPQPLCTDCLASIKENERELERERAEESSTTSNLVLWLYIFGGVFAGLIIFTAVLQGVRNIFR